MKKIFFIIIGIILITGIITGIYLYSKIFSPNVKNPSDIYIHSGSDFNTVCEILDSLDVLKEKNSFILTATIKKYPKHIKSGKYTIKSGMSNNQIVNMLRSGRQTPVKVIFNNIRTKEQLAGKISKQIEADSTDILNALNNDSLVSSFGFTTTNILAMFIPNTYEFYWNTSAEKFLTRMHKEYLKFWNKNRLKKAHEIGLTPIEVSILASIVQAEQAVHIDEQPIIAGIYINRLRKGMHLESCPTLIYAIGDFSIKRVLDVHKKVDSPFNTYKNPGLPPAPINLPEIHAIDAVLNYDKNDFLFMCAKADFSGRHHFSKTNAEHSYYARLYQQELNRRGIKK